MNQDQTTIACPNCGTEIVVHDILYHQVGEPHKKKYQDELRREQHTPNENICFGAFIESIAIMMSVFSQVPD